MLGGAFMENLLNDDVKLTEEDAIILAKQEQAKKEELFSRTILKVSKRLSEDEEYRKEISKMIS
jgi:hypothetical protein